MLRKVIFYGVGLALAMSLGVTSTAVAAANNNSTTAASYNNMFIAYYSPADVTAMSKYLKAEKLGGNILWEVSGDAAYGSSDSLLGTLNTDLKGYTVDGKPPLVMGYWVNWGLYSETAAISTPAYPIPNSINGTTGKPATNKDLTEKLAGINMLAYSFFEAQTKSFTYYDAKTGKTETIANKTPDKIGTLYFNDPWADLQPSDADTICKANMAICEFALANRYSPIAFKEGAKMANFDAFAQLKHADANNPLGPLKKVISVGGYGHNNTFEDSFSNKAYIDNFVNSAATILSTPGIDGIDLDYEDPNMTHQQSQDYLALIEALSKTLGKDRITVTILADPAYLAGARNGDNGFAAGVLKHIAALVSHINLMTYDFHGAFDYNPDGTGTTGFLTNLYMPTDAPTGYKFSVQSSVAEALKQGIPAGQLTIGIPAYGRALAGIPSDNDGLYQVITPNAKIPKGNLDAAGCSEAITPLGPNSCSGSFAYNYILKNMLSNGFTQKDWKNGENNVSNGTTAYASSWTVPVA